MSRIVAVTFSCHLPGTPETSQVQARTPSAKRSAPFLPAPQTPTSPRCRWRLAMQPVGLPPKGSSFRLVSSLNQPRSQPSVSKTGRSGPCPGLVVLCPGFTSPCVRAGRGLRQGPCKSGTKRQGPHGPAAGLEVYSLLMEGVHGLLRYAACLGK